MDCDTPSSIEQVRTIASGGIYHMAAKKPKSKKTAKLRPSTKLKSTKTLKVAPMGAIDG
jgi:hypothetical protein